MSQGPIEDVLILNASDDVAGFPAMTTNLAIDIEYAVESVGPRPCDVLVSG